VGFLIVTLFSFFILFLFYLFIFIYFQNKIISIDEIPVCKTVLVLGAGLERDGTPSDILADRLISTLEVSRHKRPEKIILSGARSKNGLSEPQAMENYLLKKQVDKTIIKLDKKGFSTFHSIQNISNQKSIYPIILISQRFHLCRALFLCHYFKVPAIGLAAQNLSFSRWKIMYWNIREVFAIPFNILKIICYKVCQLNIKS